MDSKTKEDDLDRPEAPDDDDPETKSAGHFKRKTETQAYGNPGLSGVVVGTPNDFTQDFDISM